jgi:hypothetical protein
MQDNQVKHNIFIYILIGGCFIAISSSFYFFYYKKSYDFIVETSCNPETEICFFRECINIDDCPPNNYSYYSEYTLGARDFRTCGEEEDCTLACKTGLINCTKTECTDDDINDGICVEPIKDDSQI